MAKKPKKLEDLFHETLKDIYFAENKILKTLPKMAKAAQSPDLKSAFTPRVPVACPGPDVDDLAPRRLRLSQRKKSHRDM